MFWRKVSDIMWQWDAPWMKWDCCSAFAAAHGDANNRPQTDPAPLGKQSCEDMHQGRLWTTGLHKSTPHPLPQMDGYKLFTSILCAHSVHNRYYSQINHVIL